MRRLIAISGLLTALLFSLALLAQDTPVFIEGFGDIPLLDGFTEDVDGRMVFDAPSGTISQTRLVSDLKVGAAREAYVVALKGLGWQPVETEGGVQVAFDRAGTRLTLEFTEVESVVLVHVQMAPDGKEAAIVP